MNNKNPFSSLLKQFLDLIAYLLKIILGLLPSLLDRLSKDISKRLRFSISFKMTTIYTLIFSIVLLIVSSSFLLGFRLFLMSQASEVLEKNSKSLMPILTAAAELPVDRLKEYAEDEGIIITIFNNKKKVVFSTANNNIAFSDKLNSTSFRDGEHPQTIVLNKPFKLKENSHYVQVSRQLTKESAYTGVLIFLLLFINGISIIITAGIVGRTSKKMLKPVYNITETTKAISAQALDTRLDVVDSHDELKDLAETINGMLDRLQKSYEQQNRFVSDASHELRTPISVIQGYANLLHRWGKEDKAILDEAVEAIKSESENMKDLVEKLLFLARTDKNTQKIEKEEFPMNELIGEIVKETKMIAPKHNILCSRSDRLNVFADRKLLKQALRVFIDNSIKYTPEAGTIKINSFQRINFLVIEVEDNGAGISKEDLPHIFERFYRCDESRTKESGGNGLGLSIAKWIVGRHNGGIEVESALNSGTKITVSIPLRK
jgi:two-component system, OmpR family, sensor histidine kinase ArlS